MRKTKVELEYIIQMAIYGALFLYPRQVVDFEKLWKMSYEGFEKI